MFPRLNSYITSYIPAVSPAVSRLLVAMSVNTIQSQAAALDSGPSSSSSPSSKLGPKSSRSGGREIISEAGPSKLSFSVTASPALLAGANQTTFVSSHESIPTPRRPLRLWMNGETTSLHQAVLLSDLESVQGILLSGASANITDEEDMAPLHVACAHQEAPSEAVIEQLLQGGAYVDAVDQHGRTPLLYASQRGHTSLVLKLLEHGASATHTTGEGSTCLHLTSSCTVAEYLVTFGADPNAFDMAGRTPLISAASRCLLPLARQLIELGGDVNLHDGYGAGPLHHCILNSEFVELARILIHSGANVNNVDVYGYTPLHHAAAYNRDETATLLLDFNADINAAAVSTEVNTSVSHGSGVADRPPMMELLAWHGGRKNRGGGMNPLHVAAYAGSAATLRALLDKGASVSKTSHEQLTALHYCAQAQGQRQIDAARVLIEHGADVNAKGKINKAPLHYVAVTGFVGLAKFLVENGARVAPLDTSHRTPIQVAEELGHKELHEYLTSRDKRNGLMKWRDILRQ
jgi:ankyrin repeat protein